ncbi:MAG: zinc-dependent alcohol dehydrogenase [Bryobacteraceae bacterium]
MTRVAELAGVRRFRLAEAETADPGPGEIQVRVQAVGVCGSDLHCYSEGAVGDTPCVYPMVLGHEPAGVVARCGAGVSGWSPGDLAAFEPAVYCYHCEFCLSGRHNLCANLRFLSMPGDPGFFRDVVNLPAGNLLALPRPLDATLGTLVEPLAVALHSMRFAAIRTGETAAVFGAGPIGLLTVAVLKLSGAQRVWVVDPLPHRREMARAIGADVALEPGGAAEILADTGQRGVDVVFDCASKDSTANQAIEVARHGGRVVYTGIPAELQVPLDFHPWRRKELALYQVRRSCHEAPAARDLLVEHARRLGPMVTHTRPLEAIGGAFDLVERYADGVGKMVIRLDG